MPPAASCTPREGWPPAPAIRRHSSSHGPSACCSNSASVVANRLPGMSQRTPPRDGLKPGADERLHRKDSASTLFDRSGPTPAPPEPFAARRRGSVARHAGAPTPMNAEPPVRHAAVNHGTRGLQVELASPLVANGPFEAVPALPDSNVFSVQDPDAKRAPRLHVPSADAADDEIAPRHRHVEKASPFPQPARLSPAPPDPPSYPHTNSESGFYSYEPPPPWAPPPPPPPPPRVAAHQALQQSHPPQPSPQRRMSVPCGLTEARLTEFLSRLEQARVDQDEIRERREQTLTERRKLQEKRKQLRGRRLEARDVEGELMTELRQISLNAKQLDPSALFDLYQAAQDARDALGMLEEDYDDQERHYDTLEWQLSTKESGFYADLVEDIEDIKVAPPLAPEQWPAPLASLVMKPAAPGSDVVPDSRPDLVSDRFKEFRLEQSRLYNHDDPDEIDPAEHPKQQQTVELPEITNGPHKDRLEDTVNEKMKIIEDTWNQEARRASEPHRIGSQLLALPQSRVEFQRPRSESGIEYLREQYSSVEDHISQWILEALEESSLQKAIAKAQFRGQDLDNRKWWDLVKRLWPMSGENAYVVGRDGDGGQGHVETGEAEV